MLPSYDKLGETFLLFVYVNTRLNHPGKLLRFKRLGFKSRVTRKLIRSLKSTNLLDSKFCNCRYYFVIEIKINTCITI